MMGGIGTMDWFAPDRRRRCVVWIVIICVLVAGALALWSGDVPFYPP